MFNKNFFICISLLTCNIFSNNTLVKSFAEDNISLVKMDYINREEGTEYLSGGNVACVSIYSYNGISSSSNLFTGHAFLTIKNLTKSSLIVGKMTLDANESISLGTWPKKAHFGVWYNLESYLSKNNEFTTSVSLNEEITYGSLIKLNEYISSHDVWQPMINCSSFAIRAWNSACSETLKENDGIETPTHLKEIIMNNNDCVVNRYISYNDNIGFYEDNNFIKISPSEL